MKICGVEEAEMSEAYAAYAYLAYVETTLESYEDERPTSPPPSPPLDVPQNLHLPLPPSISSSDSGRLQLQHRSHKTPSFSRPLHHRLHGDPSCEEACPAIRVDFLTHLPPEISVYILSFLHPKYLCRVVRVSRMWRWLAQYSCLRTQRLRYIQRKREKFLQSKENVVPGHRLMTQTPQTLTRNSLTDSRRSSPLASIQVSSSRQRHTRQTRLYSPYGGRAQDEDTPVQSPRYSRSLRRSSRYQAVMQSPVLDTPEGGSRRRLTGEESSYIVRRCLFPHTPSNFPPHSPSLTAPNQPRHHSLDDNNFTGIDAHLSVKKSASKRRLKRL